MPISSEAAAVPPDYSLRLDHSDNIQDEGKGSVEPDQDQPSEVSQPHSCGLGSNLLAKHQVFSLESRLRAHPRSDHEQKPGQEREHRALQYHTRAVSSRRIGFSVGTTLIEAWNQSGPGCPHAPLSTARRAKSKSLNPYAGEFLVCEHKDNDETINAGTAFSTVGFTGSDKSSYGGRSSRIANRLRLNASRFAPSVRRTLRFPAMAARASIKLGKPSCTRMPPAGGLSTG